MEIEKEEAGHRISLETMEYVANLAKLELSGEEQSQAREDLEAMLRYVDKLKELDTDGVEPLYQLFPVCNVFREDVVENGDDSQNLLKNAPDRSGQCFRVPKTVEQGVGA